MEEKINIGNTDAHLTEQEKDVLDEFILDVKNVDAIIPLHEENNRVYYDRENGEGASLQLLKNHLRYIIENGAFSDEQIKKLSGLI